MSKKRDEIDLSEFDLDDQLDFDLDFDPPPPAVPEKTRDAILSLPKHLAKGALRAAVAPGKRDEMIRKSLPKEYKAGYEAYDSLTNQGNKILGTAKDEYRKTKQELKRAGRDILPTVKNFMPKKLYDKLLEASKDTSGKFANYDARLAEIESAQANIFDRPEGTSNKQPDRRMVDAILQERAESDIRNQANDIKLNRLVDLVTGIGKDTGNMVGYQTTITTDYRRKLLELNYRQYFAMTDLVEITKASSERSTAALESIVHNTALPDYAKEEFGEITSALMKRKVAEMISPANLFKDYISKFGENVQSKIKDVFSGARSGLSAASTAAMMSSMDMGDDNLSPAQRRNQAMQTGAVHAGGFIFDQFAGKWIDKGAAKVKDYLSKDNTTSNFMRKGAYTLMNLPQILNTYAKNPYYDGHEAGVMGPLSEMLGDMLPTYNGPQARLSDRGVGALDKPTPWSTRSSVTLNEVIPGWLAKINQSIRVLGGTDAPLEQYDPQTRSFIATKEIAANIRKTVNAEDSRKWVRQKGNEIVDLLDPHKQLSVEERKILQNTIDEKARKGEKFDIRDLAGSFDAYGTAGNGKDLMGLMSHFRRIDKDEFRRNKLNLIASNTINNMRWEMGQTQSYIDEMVDRYGEGALVNANVFQRKGDRLNVNKDVFNHYSSVKGNARKDPNAKASIHSTLNAFLQSGYDPSKFPQGGNGLQQQLQLTEDTVMRGVRAALFTPELPDLVSILNKAKEAPTQADRSNTLEPLIQQIHEQLIANNLTPQIECVLMMLEEIAQGTIAGHSSDGSGAHTGSRFNTFGGHLKSFGLKSWDLLKRGGGHIGIGAVKAGTRLKKTLGGAWRLTNPFGVAKSLAIGGYEALRGFGKGLLGEFDIYDADGNLLLAGHLLKMGKYFNARGEVIKSIKDLIGAVYDETGKVIISAEELTKKLRGLKYFDAKGWHKLMAGMGAGVGTLVNKLITAPKTGLEFALKLAKGIKNEIIANQDIYVKGETEPRLYHAQMAKGWYFSRKSGHVIRTINDIDGPVINRYGEVILSEEEMAKPGFQLVDVKGKPSKSNFHLLAEGVAKTAKAAWGLAKLPMKVLMKGGVLARDLVMSGGEWFSKLVSGKIDFSASFGTSKVVDRLDKIYKLLDDRLGDNHITRKERQQSGDIDGDGERDNSFRAIFKRRRAERQAKLDAEKAKGKDGVAKGEKSKGLLGLLGALGGGLISIVGGIGKTLGNVFMKVIGNSIGAVFSKVLFPIFKVGGQLLGAAFTKVLGPVLKGVGAVGGALGRGALAVGGVVARTAGRVVTWAAKDVLWAGARYIGMAAIGAVSAPVAIGAGIIAGVAAIGYGAYKLSQRKINTQLDQLRFAYYGTEEYERGDKNDCAKLRYLEAEFGKFTTYDGEGVAALKSMSREIILKIAQGIEIPVNDEDNKTLFERWILGRFIPLYLLWATRARQASNGGTLEALAKDNYLTPKERLKFIDKIELPKDHPIYNVDKGPFEDEDLVKADAVESLTKDVKKDLKALIDAQLTVEDAKKIKDSGGQPAFLQTDFGKTPAMTNLMGGTAVKEKPPVQKPVDTLNAAALTGPNALDQADPTLTAIKSGGVKLGRHVGNMLNALDSVRLKTYGLTDLTESRVRPIYELEEAVFPYIVKDNAAYVFKGDLNKLVTDFAAKFGYQPATKDTDDTNNEFKLWLSQRFIPTLVQFVSLSRTLVPNANPFALVISSATGGLYDIAVGTRDAKFENDKAFNTVWSVMSRPFGDMDRANMDPTSCDGNIEYLLRLRKEFELKQQTAEKSSNKVLLINDLNKTLDTSKRGDGKQGSFGTDLGRSVMNDKRYDGSANGPAVDADYGGYVDSPVGQRGEGGYYDIRAKNKSKEAMVDVIKQVAKLTGVDAGLLLSVAMAESTLDPNAGASTSSAKGLFQFLYGKPDSTWALMLAKYGNEFGIPANASPFDPVANSILGAMYIKESIDSAKKANGGRPITPADIYLGHFLGQGGQAKFLKNLAANPNRIAAADFGNFAPKTPSGSNRSIFAADKGTGDPYTYAQVYNLMQKKMRNNHSQIAELAGGAGDSMKYAANGSPKAPSDKGVDTPASDAAKTNAATAKAASDAKTSVKVAGANDSANTSGTNKALDDKPYVNNAVNQAQKVATSDAAVNDLRKNSKDIQSQIEIEKAKVSSQTDTTMRQVANSQYQQSVSNDGYLKDQCESLRSIYQILTEISSKMSTSSVLSGMAQNAKATANATPPMNYVVKHDKAPVDVNRIKS